MWRLMSEMIVIVDTREQAPFDFTHFPDVETRRDTLATGDYSLSGFESVIACERKELNDLIACLQNGNRERFERELARGSALHRFCVLVEGCRGALYFDKSFHVAPTGFDV